MEPISRRCALSIGAAGALAALSPASAAPPAAPQTAPTPGPDTPADAAGGARTRFAVNVETWWPSLPFLDRLRAAADLGFPAIELWPWRGRDVDAIARACDELGLAVAQFTAWGFSPPLNDPAHLAAFLAEIEASCAAARALGARCMTVVAGDDRAGATRAEMHAAVRAALERAAPIAADAEVTLILEPMNVRVDHPGHCLYGSPDAVAICRAVAHPRVKINWDLYHMQISEGDLCGRLREGFDQVGYVQVADHPGRHEPGTGEIHYPRVLRELHELGYRGYVGLECRPRDGEEQAARRVREADRW